MPEESDYKFNHETTTNEWLFRIARELTTLRTQQTELLKFYRDAEKEVPESLRRFANYMHDMHDIKYMYEEHGQSVPPWVRKELERCDDRYKQIMMDQKAEGGAINKVLREMAEHPAGNRWDHTKQLPKPKENGSDTTG